MRKFIIDGQVFQTPALHRGMGKYSIELIKSLVRQNRKNWSSFEVVLSKKSKQNREEVEALLADIPDLKIIYLNLEPNIIGERQIVQHNRKTIESYIGKDEADYLVLSLMQGEIAPAFPEQNNVRTMVVFYDLIPLMFHKTYLLNPVTREEYLFKLKELLKADLYLAISQTVANDLSLYLGVDKTRVVSIDGGPIVHGEEEPYTIKDPFILMPTGNDYRKNNRNGIIGFEKFNTRKNGKYKLVITSFFKDHEIEELKSLSKNLVFTGNISGQQMQYLYKNCTALLFPSEYEGLGLPILEAVDASKPIACSDISVFREMSTKDFDVFDPKNVNQIADSIDQAIHHREVNKKNYSQILAKYTWANTAKELINALHTVKKVAINKKNITQVLPDTTKSEPLSRYQTLAHAELSRQFNTVYCFTFVSDNKRQEARVNYLPYVARPLVLSEASNADEPYVYHIDNCQSSSEVLLMALAKKGIVVLYDSVLTKAWEHLVERKLVSRSRLDLEKQLDELYCEPKTSLITSLVSNQKAVIVFDPNIQKSIQKILSATNSGRTKVVLAQMPVASAKYPGIFPQKTVPRLSWEANKGTKEIHKATDFDLLEELSTASVMVCNDEEHGRGSRNVIALESIVRSTNPDIKDAYVIQKRHTPASYIDFANVLTKTIEEIHE